MFSSRLRSFKASMNLKTHFYEITPVCPTWSDGEQSIHNHFNQERHFTNRIDDGLQSGVTATIKPLTANSCWQSSIETDDTTNRRRIHGGVTLRKYYIFNAISKTVTTGKQSTYDCVPKFLSMKIFKLAVKSTNWSYNWLSNDNIFKYFYSLFL